MSEPLDTAMTRDRDLAAYVGVLGVDFVATLDALRAGDAWIDAGAGEARAMAAFAQRAGREGIRLVALDDHPRARIEGVERVAASVEAADASAFGRVALVTDVYGALQYTSDPSAVLSFYGRPLRAGAPVRTFEASSS